MSEDDTSYISKHIAKCFPESESLYDILAIAKDASEEDIKRAYKRLALKLHPDRGGDEEKFKALSMVHAILSDTQRRAEYDETGTLDAGENASTKTYEEWYDYYRVLFPKIVINDIEKYKAHYLGSEEEIDDIISAYERTGGNLSIMMQYIIFAEKGCEERIINIVDELITKERLISNLVYEKAKATIMKRGRKSKSQDSTNVNKRKAKQSNDNNDLSELQAQIAGKRDTHSQRAFSAIFSKYGGDDQVPEISEKEFQAMQAKTKKSKK